LFQLSKAINGSYRNFENITLPSLSDIVEVALESNYSLSTFRDNHRHLDSFQSASLIGLDIDNGENEEQMSLEEARHIFAPYKHIILTSRSHGKIKKPGTSSEQPAADRFRVILVLSKPITDLHTYYATWHALKEKFPVIDRACKDPSRMWFASNDYVQHSDEGNLVEVVLPQPKPKAKEKPEYKPALPHQKGALSRSTIEFLTNGASPGSWNPSLFKAAKDLQQQLYSKEEAIDMLTLPTRLPGNSGELDESDLATIESAYRSVNRYAPRFAEKSNSRSIIEQSHLIVDMADTQHTHLVNLETGERYDMSRPAVKEILGPKAFAKFMEAKAIHANFIYDPHAKTILFQQSNGLPGYNMYTPPSWLLKQFYTGESLPKPEPNPPKIIDKFINHLVDNDNESKQYLFDWLHVTMTSRNYTMLTAIGEQGIGKGVLGEIMRRLVGDSNFVPTRDEIFKKSFNKQLEAKKLVYVDELALNKKEAHDRMKHMVNDILEIEAKGKDTKYIKNHASFYLSSNHYDAIKLEPGDRRFSIIQLTDTRLLEKFSHTDIEQGILGNKNVANFGNYLLHRKVKRDMRIPFKSDRFNEVMDASLKNWQRYILEQLASKSAGERIEIQELKEKLRCEFPSLTPPGRGKLVALTKSYPDKLKFVTKDNKRYLEFL